MERNDAVCVNDGKMKKNFGKTQELKMVLIAVA